MKNRTLAGKKIYPLGIYTYFVKIENLDKLHKNFARLVKSAQN